MHTLSHVKGVETQLGLEKSAVRLSGTNRFSFWASKVSTCLSKQKLRATRPMRKLEFKVFFSSSGVYCVIVLLLINELFENKQTKATKGSVINQCRTKLSAVTAQSARHKVQFRGHRSHKTGRNTSIGIDHQKPDR